ncbi:MAG: DUF503 domain-containing protein [Candidatus Aerophobetes bacterium]|nr:DUF503 domain-containing protein [Candidatus Aerophobetes bacterium]
MVIGILEVDVQLFYSNSLKDKRRIVKSLIARLKNNFNISVSEVAYQNLWRKTKLGIAFLTMEEKFAQNVLSEIIRFIHKEKRISLTTSKMEII